MEERGLPLANARKGTRLHPTVELRTPTDDIELYQLPQRPSVHRTVPHLRQRWRYPLPRRQAMGLDIRKRRWKGLKVAG